MNVNQGYESLAGVLQRALDQAQNGKGHERHANALPFHEQPMQTIAAQVGVGFLTGQAIKKAQESASLKPGADVAELLGAINYLAGAVIFLEGQRAPVAPSDNSGPIVQVKRLVELPKDALMMVRRAVDAELLRIQADEMTGKTNG